MLLQEIPLSIECFMNDKDVAGKMSRATLEGLAEQPLRRVEELMRQVLASASERGGYLFMLSNTVTDAPSPGQRQ